MLLFDMDDLPLTVDAKMPSDDLGHMRCSDLDMPLFTLENFVLGVLSFLNGITYERRKLLANGRIDSETVLLLSDMCQMILELCTEIVLEDVIPQVQSMMHSQIEQGHNYFTVTEEDIQASFGDSFHTCFGVALGVEQERSCYSETLIELFAAEVTKRVNQKLDTITRSSSSPQSTDSAESETSIACHTKDMVYNIGRILSECLGRIYQLESPEDQETLESELSKGYGPDEECNGDLKADESETTHSLPENAGVSQSEIAESSVIPEEEDQESLDSELSEGSRPDKEYYQLKEEDALSESPDLEIIESSYSPLSDLEQHDWDFLAEFICKLLNHIAYSTKASLFNVHFDDIIVYLRQCTMGSVTLPQTVGDIHIPVYEELCRQFGSANVLRDVMVSGDVAFEEAVARTLKAELQKPSGENISFRTKLKRFFCKNSRAVAPEPMIAPEPMNTSADMVSGGVASEEETVSTSEEPTCVSFFTKLKRIFCRKRRDVGQESMNTSVSYTEVIELVNGMTPPPPQRTQKLPAIHRKMSSMARILRRPFTCCICAAQDDYNTQASNIQSFRSVRSLAHSSWEKN